MLPDLIGITGKARSGKSSVAVYLHERYGYTIVSCVEHMKSLVIAGLERNPPPDSEGTWNWDHLVRHDRSPFTRWLLQFVGTDIGRRLDPDIWVRQMGGQASNILISGDRVVVPDIRFLNEAREIRRLGGEVWRTVRTDQHAGAEHGATHESELELETIQADRGLVAGVGVEHLYLRVEEIREESRTAV